MPCECWFCLTAVDASCPYKACPLATFLQLEFCHWQDRYKSNKLGDRKAKISPPKWHFEPYGFEIIGSKRTKRKRRRRRRRNREKEAYFSYTDALRTIHLTCCEPVTVSSCLADNMAKGIHLNRPTTKKELGTCLLEKKDFFGDHCNTSIGSQSSLWSL